MLNLKILAISTAAAASMLAVPLSSQEIVVSPQTQQAFVAQVSSDLDNKLRKMRIDHRWEPAGIVKVRFRANDDGTPKDISTYESSGDYRLDRTVRRAISRLENLAPLPASAGYDPMIQANIIVASSRRQMESLSEKLAQSEATRLASGDVEERAVLAINLSPRPSS